MDLSSLSTYKESNRLEMKAAQGRDGQGALPRSIWETVSAFANTAGGTIVLGAKELAGGGFDVVGLANPDKILDDFWNAVHGKDKLSARFLKDKDASIEEVDSKHVVVIRVPWVDRYTRPVFIDNDLFGGTFRRAHTGDHRCSREEVLSMLRDSDTSSQDAAVAESGKLRYINSDTVKRYRRRFNERNENHVWSRLDDNAFLSNIGALAEVEDGVYKPTRAGLLMFGEDRWISREFPHYFLDYREETSGQTRWDDRFTSQPGDWSGNIYDFYTRAYNKLKAALKVPFRLEGIYRVDDTPAHEALREALANCLTNANWFDRRGVVCLWTNEAITIANPGDFRMPLEEARKPGKSDPRNETIMKMFSMVEIGERAGSGMDKIFGGWAWAGYAEPSYEVEYGPDRTTLTLPLVAKKKPTESRSQKVDAKSGRKKWTQKVDAKPSKAQQSKDAILMLVGEQQPISRAQIAASTGFSPSWTSKLLGELVEEGLLVREGTGRAGTYRVKES